MVSDLVQETERRLADCKPASAAALRALDRPVVAFSPETGEAIRRLREFLRRHMYDHYKVMRMARKAQRVVVELFEAFFACPDCLPPEWSVLAFDAGEADRAQAISDYIAGMTDRYALQEHDRLFKFTKRDP
jgi:dGTPase